MEGTGDRGQSWESSRWQGSRGDGTAELSTHRSAGSMGRSLAEASSQWKPVQHLHPTHSCWGPWSLSCSQLTNPGASGMAQVTQSCLQFDPHKSGIFVGGGCPGTTQ